MKMTSSLYSLYIKILYKLYKNAPILNIIFYTKDTQSPVSLSHIIKQKIFRKNSSAYWPVHFTSMVKGGKNVYLGIDTAPGFMPGCYIQAIDKIYIGDYSQFGPNVGLISTNHNIYDTRQNINKGPIRIGKYCWVGMNSVILPGVILGNHTVVAAGSIVTHSFPDGYCVIGGNPATLLFNIDSSKIIQYENHYKYHGFIEDSKFRKNITKYFRE